MESYEFHPRLVHRTARVRLRVTRHQADRCFGLLRSAGDLWAWLLDTNRERLVQGAAPIVGYQALCRELTARGPAGELSVVGARSVLARYSDSWFAAAKRRRKGEPAGFPRRKRLLVPVRFHHQTFQLDGRRVRLPVARGRPALWVRTARPIPYPADRIRAVTLVADCGQLWLAVTAAVPIHHHDLDPRQVAGVDLGIIHPYAVVAEHAALLVSGRAIRAESFLHLRDQQARQAKTARRAPKPRATWLAPLAALSSPPTAGRGPPPPPSPSSPPPGSQPGRRLRRAPADRRAGHWRPDRHHHPRCRSGAQPAAAAMAPHPPGPSVERQGRTGWHRRSPGGRARYLFHLPSLPATGPQTIWPPIPLPGLHLPGAPRPGRCCQHRRHPRRRNHQRNSPHAGRAPPSRHRAGTT